MSRYQAQQSIMSDPYPYYSGFFGYIVPYNDGEHVKILKGDGTLREAFPVSDMMSTTCGAMTSPGPHTITDNRMPPGTRRWCPSDFPDEIYQSRNLNPKFTQCNSR